MDPRKTGAPDTHTTVRDGVGPEERVLEHSGEAYPASEATGVVKIVITDDQFANALEMFQSECDDVEPDPSTAGLDIAKHPSIHPSMMAAFPAAVRLAVSHWWPRRSHLPSMSVAQITTISALVLLGGTLVINRMGSAPFDDLLQSRTTTSPVIEVRPPGEIQDAAAAPATDGTIDGSSTPVATPKDVGTSSVRGVPQRPRQQARNIPANVVARPPARETTPPLAPRPYSVAASAITTPPPVTTPEREEKLAPRVEERPLGPPSPPSPPVIAATAAPAVPVASPAPPVTTPTPAPSASAPTPAPTADSRAVAVVLNRYQQAFSAMDVGAAHAVWPSVDVKALAKAFDQLEEQTFDLVGCNITVAGIRAEADCGGNASYIRKVGNRAMRVEPRHWRFRLRQANDAWVIDAVDAR
jgi:hypothetical protein